MSGQEDIRAAFDAAGLQATDVALKKHNFLFRTGDQVKRMFFVRTGRLVMVRILESGQELVVQRADPGDLFAEASLFSDRYHCDAVGETDVRCTAYDKAAVLEALNDPAMAMLMLKAYSIQIRGLRNQIELRNIKRADDRVYSYLQSLPPDAKGWRDPHLSWKDISRTLGLSHEACYRALALLDKSKRIEREENRCRLI
ncbi:Global nitrogen regulator [Labrenzia sp. THAF82]|uniref:Crp/Fnr family transcriptional regulator n=1 Tax=Labrenzia sp. THAF82 TaxID=2587861 RepID=UPI001267D04D|nr:Crp/Fnr family transcriptional regulator [Labrenzia sp. THAF82]QFT34393.1 Global nitrogen regulator [Labrenzia sp. THAF82]